MHGSTDDLAENCGMLDRGDGVRLAWARRDGAGPTVVFLPGFGSDMTGTKVLALRDFCRDRGQALLRLDYSGHGASGGAFRDGTIGRWTADALAVIRHAAPDGKLILVGSSMGGWIGLKLAVALGGRVAGFIGIAAAPDFTDTLLWPSLSPAQQEAVMTKGEAEIPSPYGAGFVVTRALIEDGRAQSVLTAPLNLSCPVRLLHGQQDPDVPWRTALAIAERVTGGDVEIVLVKDGDHRLSRPRDLALLMRTLATLLGENGGESLAIGGEAPAIAEP